MGHKDDKRRANRELIELLNELRVVMPGVQVLFGFLLTVPFQQGFDRIDDFQRIVYVVTLLLTAAAAAFLMAPSAFHRLTFRRGEKPHLIALGTRYLIIGMALLLLAMNGAILLIMDIIFHSATVAVLVAATFALYGWLWFGIGWRRRVADTSAG